MENEIPNLEDFLAAAHLSGSMAVRLDRIVSEDPDLVRKLEAFDPLRLAGTFGGLLTVPDLQSNCLRLEALVHLAIACCKGKRKPNASIIGHAFTALGSGVCGRSEDPAEDVFVTSVSSPRGNFRVLEGIWESSGFYLQRVVNVLEGMPHDENYDDIRECVYSLLRLSDSVCDRAKLVRYQLGNATPSQSLAGKVIAALSSIRRSIRFSEAELVSVGFSINHLCQFVFDPNDRKSLLSETIGHSILERYPVAWRNAEFFFVLPTATSSASRRFVVERMDAAGMRETFLAALAYEYADVFAQAPLLGGPSGAPIEFKRTEKGLLAGAMRRVDRGRYVNFVFVVDTLEGFESTGFAGTNPDPTRLADDIDRWIDKAYASVRKNKGFLEGITLFVGCGIGRGTVHHLNNRDRPNWHIEFTSASDLYTLSWAPDFKPLSLWRILGAQSLLQSLGVELHNINGLLNLVAWARSLEGHLVPHGRLPDDFGHDDRSTFFMIQQNSLRDLRHEVAVAWDVHVERDM